MIKKKIVIGSLVLGISVYLLTLATGEEPSRPNVDTDLSPVKEAKIDAARALRVKDGLARLKEEVFIEEDNYLKKAIHVTFVDRSEEAVDTAINLLKEPRVKIENNKRKDRTKEMFVAKKILQTFPDESLPKISEAYNTGNNTTKSNLIETLGNMEGDEARNMLISALDDKTSIETESLEIVGEPMRICDAAYNQLVLRYMIPDVLRTIGSVHTLEQRDYHISILKEKL